MTNYSGGGTYRPANEKPEDEPKVAPAPFISERMKIANEAVGAGNNQWSAVDNNGNFIYGT
jgi:hypothetical protein